MRSFAFVSLFLLCTALPAQSGRYPFSDRNSFEVMSIETDWIFLAEKPGQGLSVPAPPSFAGGIAVRLPHSVVLPNQAFWYTCNLSLPDSAIYLAVSADDGAQVWLNGEALDRDRSGNFLLPLPRTASGQHQLAIRVLNNALAGGLKSVELRSAKKHSPPLSFSFWGDSQGGWPVFGQLLEQMKQFPDRFSLGLGDLVGNGSNRKQWLEFELLIYNLASDREVMLIPGNHDYDGYYQDLVSQNYRQMMQLGSEQPTWYSFSRDNAIFLMLDPNGSFPLAIDTLQHQWALEVMSSEAWQQADWRFVALHQFPYGQGWAGHEGDDFLRQWIDSLAEKYRIDFVLGGHNHDYERLSQKYGAHTTHFIISGGAGGGLEASANNPGPVMDQVHKLHHFCRMILRERDAELIVYGIDGKIIDNPIFTKP